MAGLTAAYSLSAASATHRRSLDVIRVSLDDFKYDYRNNQGVAGGRKYPPRSLLKMNPKMYQRRRITACATSTPSHPTSIRKPPFSF